MWGFASLRQRPPSEPAQGMGAGGEGGSRTAPTGGRRRRAAQGGGLRWPVVVVRGPLTSILSRWETPVCVTLGRGLLQGRADPTSPRPHPNPLPAGEGEDLPALPVSQPSGGLRKGLPWGELCVTLGRGLLQGRADPTSPRPHPNPLPAGEGEDLPAPPVSQPSGGLREGLQRKRAPEGTGAHKGRPYGRERRRAALGGGPQWALAVERGPLTSILSRWERRFKRLHPAACRRRPRRPCPPATGAAIGAARGGRW